MRFAWLCFVLVTASCSSSDEDCLKASFFPINAAAKCRERTSVGAGCASAPGPAVERCSVGADGKFYLSEDGRIFPDGRECTDAERSSLGSLPTCP